MTNGAEVLLDQLILDGVSLCGKKSCADLIGKNMEEGDRVFNGLDVRGDVQPDAEAPQLAPGSGVFFE